MINIFDINNIYDRLLFDRIDPRIKGLINSALGNHFPSLDALWLIQRWHPHNVAWAENLTDVFFEFLKPLSRTHLLTNGEINGSAYGFEPEYTADLPNELNLPEFPDEVTLKVPKGKSASISWIERSHDVLTNFINCETTTPNADTTDFLWVDNTSPNACHGKIHHIILSNQNLTVGQLYSANVAGYGANVKWCCLGKVGNYTTPGTNKTALFPVWT